MKRRMPVLFWETPRHMVLLCTELPKRSINFSKKNHQLVLSDSLTLLLQILTWLCLLPTPFPGFRAGPLQRHEILSLFLASTSCFARRCPGVVDGWEGEISLPCLPHPWACPEGQEYQSGWVLKQQRLRPGQGGRDTGQGLWNQTQRTLNPRASPW